MKTFFDSIHEAEPGSFSLLSSDLIQKICALIGLEFFVYLCPFGELVERRNFFLFFIFVSPATSHNAFVQWMNEVEIMDPAIIIIHKVFSINLYH